MSYVTLRLIEKDGSITKRAEAANNHGFAPLVWDTFAKEFTGYAGKYGVMVEGMMGGDESPLRKVWALFGSGKLDTLDDILLGSTFDRVWIKRERIPLFVEALDRFYEKFIKGKYVETTKQMADILRKFYSEHPDALGVALDQCSANPTWWDKKVTVKDEDENEYEDYEPLNILTDKLASDGKPHWEIGEEPT